jgi:hypothetical protein
MQKCSYLLLSKMCLNRWQLELCPVPYGGVYSAPPDLSLGLRGLLCGGEGGEEIDSNMEGKGNEKGKAWCERKGLREGLFQNEGAQYLKEQPVLIFNLCDNFNYKKIFILGGLP